MHHLTDPATSTAGMADSSPYRQLTCSQRFARHNGEMHSSEFNKIPSHLRPPCCASRAMSNQGEVYGHYGHLVATTARSAQLCLTRQRHACGVDRSHQGQGQMHRLLHGKLLMMMLSPSRVSAHACSPLTS